MTTSNRRHNFFEIQKREHQEMVGVLGEIHRALRNRQSCGTPLQTMIGEFCANVERHMTDEERDGYLAEVLLVAPEWKDRAEALRREHEELRRRIADLKAAIGRPTSEGDWWTEVESVFDQLSGQLLRHEAQEDDLVQRALTPGEFMAVQVNPTPGVKKPRRPTAR